MNNINRIDINGRPHWVYEDGTILPVIRGGSDGGIPAPPAPGVDPSGLNITIPGGLNQGINPTYFTPAPPAPPTGVPGQPQPGQRFFTEDDVARIREEEKNKLYPTIEQQKARLLEYENHATEQTRLAAEAQAAVDAEARRVAEERMSVQDLIATRDREWEGKFSALQADTARERATNDQERRYQALQTYKANVLAANASEILPEFADPDLVFGDTEDQINISVAKLVAKSASVMQNVQGVQDETRRGAPLVSPTSPSVGPMEMGQQFRTLSAEQIAAMPMGEYAKIRQYLPSGQSDRGDQGMFR